MRTLYITLLVTLAAGTASAQNIDEALRLYKKREFTDAALAFYDVLQNDRNPDNRDQAEIYLAETLFKMRFYVPALFYYQDIFKTGRNNRYYLNAVEGLLRTQEELHDPLFIPSLINEYLDPDGFGQLDPEKIHHVNYLIGELSYRGRKNQDAHAFLSYVPPESSFHPKARYVLGLLEVRLGKLPAAEEHFRRILEIIPEDTGNEELLRVRNLAIIAAARAAYGQGKFDKATELYKQVPRFSDEWFTALYENAWAHFQQRQYGKALGEVQSVTSPYFAKRHVPEAYVIAATAYFVNCQWDRVRREVGRYKRSYEPMLNTLKSYLEEKRQPVAYYQDVVAGGGGKFSVEIARDVRRTRRFLDYHFMLTHMEWETKEIAETKEWKGARLGDDLIEVIRQQRDQLEPAVGRWVKGELVRRQNSLQNFQNQINILDFEVADAERRWLEMGKEVLKGRRARLPRPEIPNDQWQHWNFDHEYWKDELGYIQHSLGDECLDVGT
jgi:tetratricopeptide (TPR) repeat protein